MLVVYCILGLSLERQIMNDTSKWCNCGLLPGSWSLDFGGQTSLSVAVIANPTGLVHCRDSLC